MFKLKKNRSLTICFACLIFQFSFAQIKITEVYADTPYSESVYTTQNYLGEYIELYNYSSEDISLAGWSISDKVGKFYFPNSTVLPSEGFMIIAYRPSFSVESYFPSFFHTTQGKEAQIIYQDRIVLRNPREKIKLNMGILHGINFGGFTISEAKWGGEAYNVNEEQAYQQGPEYVNYYIKSYHFIDNENYVKSIATPLEEHDVPLTQNMEDIVSFQEAVLNQLTDFTWTQNAQIVLSNSCPLTISEVSQSPVGIFGEGILCFNYDNSGNCTNMIECDSDENGNNDGNQNNNGYSQSELENIASKIVVYPNPTCGIINLSWDSSVDGKLSNMLIISLTGSTICNSDIFLGNLSIQCDLSFSSPGYYVVRFTLATGQEISKIVIRSTDCD